MSGLPRSRLQLVGVDESGGFSSAYQHALQRRGVLLPMANSFQELKRQASREFWPTDDEAEEGGAPGKDGSARMTDAVDAPSSASSIGSVSGSVPPSHVIRIFLQEGVTPGVDRYSGVSWGGEVTAANFQLLRDNDRLEVVRMRAPTPAPAAPAHHRAQSNRHTNAAVGMNGHGKRKRDDASPMARVPASSNPAAGARQPLSSAAATAATSMPSTPPRSAAPAVALVDSPMPPLENARGEVQSQAGYLVATAMPPTRPTTNFSAPGASTGALGALPPPIASFAHPADGPSAGAHLASVQANFAFQQHQQQMQLAQRQADQQQQQQQQQQAMQQQQQQQANHAAQAQLEHARAVQHMQHQQQMHQQQMVAEMQQSLMNETVIHQMLGTVLQHQIGQFPTAGMQQQQQPPAALFQQQQLPPPPPPTRLIGVNRGQTTHAPPTHRQPQQPRQQQQQQQPQQQQRQAQPMRVTQPAPSLPTSAPTGVSAMRSKEPTPPPPPATATAAGAAPAVPSPPAPAPRPATPSAAVDSTSVASAPTTTSDVDAFIMIHFIRFVAPAAGTSADSSAAGQLEAAPLVSIRMKRKKQLSKGFKAFCGYLQADSDEYRFYRAARTGLTHDQLKADPTLYDTRVEGTDTPHALGWQEEQFVLAKQASA